MPGSRRFPWSAWQSLTAATEYSHRIYIDLLDQEDNQHTVVIYDKSVSVYNGDGAVERITCYYIRKTPDWERIEEYL